MTAGEAPAGGVVHAASAGFESARRLEGLPAGHPAEFERRRHALQAAHRLPFVASDHKCGRMHWHGFGIVLHAREDPGGAPTPPAASTAPGPRCTRSSTMPA